MILKLLITILSNVTLMANLTCAEVGEIWKTTRGSLCKTDSCSVMSTHEDHLVLATVLNRAKVWNMTISQVIKQSGQFPKLCRHNKPSARHYLRAARFLISPKLPKKWRDDILWYVTPKRLTALRVQRPKSHWTRKVCYLRMRHCFMYRK